MEPNSLYGLTFKLVQMEMVSNIQTSILEVSHKLVDLNPINLNRGQSKFFGSVKRKLFLPQRE